MRIYNDCREMYSEEQRNLHEMGIKVHPQTMQDRIVEGDPAFATLELSPCVFTILHGQSDRNVFIKERGGNLAWCQADLRERLTGFFNIQPVNPGSAWEMRRGVWEDFMHGGRFAYTYSERLGTHVLGKTPLHYVEHELKARPDTRQAVLPVFSGALDFPHLGGGGRVPCSMYYQFLRRPDGLRCFYTMRSTDFATHFPYDVWMALALQAELACRLAIPASQFTFFSGSLHLYAKDADPGVF